MKTNTPKLMILSSALAGMMALGGVAFAGPGGGSCDGNGRNGRGGGHGPGMKMMRMMGSLDLTEDQEVQLVRIRRALREERKALKATRKTDRAAMKAEMAKETPNAQVLHQLLDKRMNMKRSIAHSAIDKMLAFRATLTPDQKAQLQQRMDKMKERRAKRGKRGGGRNAQ